MGLRTQTDRPQTASRTPRYTTANVLAFPERLAMMHEPFLECEFLPLGMNCDVAHCLRQFSLRETAYPFDWNVSSLSAVGNLIESDFDGFLDPKNLIFLKPTKRLLFVESDNNDVQICDDIVTPVVCKKYNVLFPHDFSIKGALDLPEVQQKYMRRIAKLRNALARATTTPTICVAGLATLNDWQIEKYREAGVAPPPTTPKSFFEGLARLDALLPLETRLMPLSQLRLKLAQYTPNN